MAEARIPAEYWLAMFLNAQVKAAEHVRDCARCRRLFKTALEEVLNGATTSVSESMPWKITNDLLPELRICKDWPNGI